MSSAIILNRYSINRDSMFSLPDRHFMRPHKMRIENKPVHQVSWVHTNCWDPPLIHCTNNQGASYKKKEQIYREALTSIFRQSTTGMILCINIRFIIFCMDGQWIKAGWRYRAFWCKHDVNRSIGRLHKKRYMLLKLICAIRHLPSTGIPVQKNKISRCVKK